MTGEPYADIHHYDGQDKTALDEDGDQRLGWYFQYMADQEPLTTMFGPYGTSKECEAAAIREWVTS